jgi:hypothetical protein
MNYLRCRENKYLAKREEVIEPGFETKKIRFQRLNIALSTTSYLIYCFSWDFNHESQN